jgi:ATP-dependent helicase YprA (DUF1998 family)/predicted phosphodiesterase
MMTKNVNYNSWMHKEEKYPIKATKPRQWTTIYKQPASLPQKELNLCWQDLLPSYAQSLAEVIESIIGSAHPYMHQKQALEYLLESTTKRENTGLIINGGTYSGKSLSFSIPGIVKLLGEETDFIVVFYPSKQLLLDQFERMKEYLVRLEETSGARLTCKVYSGDIGKTKANNEVLAQEHQQELYGTEQNPPNILLATFDKVWYQLIAGKKTPLLEKIMECQYLVFDEIHAFEGFAAAIIRGFVKIHLKRNPLCHVILSSATIDNVDGFRDDFLPNARIITCPPVRGDQEYLGITVDHVVSILAELWDELESTPGKFCLVFLDSKAEIEVLFGKLCQKLKQDNSFFDEGTVGMIHADLPYYQRKKILDEVRKKLENNIRILLSSSVLELGVNLPNIQVVINIGIPITQKDGIIQRMARNRSIPGDKRVNIFMFNLADRRDAFYWNHQELLADILETNACNPILYPKQNSKILAGLIILHLRYGFTKFDKLMQYFLQDGVDVYQLARQQYTKLVSLMVLKKEYGEILFTSQGESIVREQAMNDKNLIPFSIRAIASNWSIIQEVGLQSNWNTNKSIQIGSISARDVLRRALPGNIIVRNKQKFLVTEINHYDTSIRVKKFVTKEQGFFSQKSNRLYDPTVTLGVFPKKTRGTKLLEVKFGQLFVHRRPAAVANFNPDNRYSQEIRQQADQSFFWQKLTPQESEEFALTEQSEGIVFSLMTDLPKSNNLTNKKVLEYFGKVLRIEIEAVLSIPITELTLVYNANQLALYDKGGSNGNTAFLFTQFQRVAQQALKRLNNCPCNRGCEYCYGEILGLLPEGMKTILQTLIKDLARIEGQTQARELSAVPDYQLNYQESRIVALSDIHLTSEYCYQEEFFEAITLLTKQADVFLINGDLLDKVSEEGWEAFRKLRTLALQEGFWSKLVFIRSSSIHDGNLEQFSGLLHEDYARFELGSEQVLFVHGNKVGINTTTMKENSMEPTAIKSKRELVERGRSWLPTITPETHLVFGHLHTRFYNERFRVYGLGHWTVKGAPYHHQCVMILDSSFFDTLRLFSYKELKY